MRFDKIYRQHKWITDCYTEEGQKNLDFCLQGTCLYTKDSQIEGKTEQLTEKCQKPNI